MQDRTRGFSLRHTVIAVVALCATASLAAARPPLAQARANGPVSIDDDAVLMGPPAPTASAPVAHETHDALDAPAPTEDAAGSVAPATESMPLGAPNHLLSARPADEKVAEESGGGLASLDPRTNEVTRVAAALAAVLGLLLMLRWSLRRLGRRTFIGGASPSGVVEILARFPIARSQHLLLLKVARRVLVLHQNGTALSVLSEFTDADEVASLLGRIEAGTEGRQASHFQALLKDFRAEHDATAAPGGSGGSENEFIDLTRAAPARVEAERVRSKAQSTKHAAHSRRLTVFCAVCCVLCAVCFPAAAAAAPIAPAELNPIEVLEDAARSVPGFEGGLSSSLNVLLLLTVLSLAPAVLILCTCFTRIVIVLGLLRQALGTQGLPPSQVVVGLSMFVTIVVMAPTMQRMYGEGIEPYASGEQLDASIAWERTRQPLRDFLFAQIEATGNWSGVYMMLNYRGIDTSDPGSLTRADVDMLTLVPAYVLSELKVAFLMGFRMYLPFLVIDMVIASMLISMGMLMLPPVLISLPFKLLLFILVDGWQLVVGSLMTSVSQPGKGEMMQSAAMLMSGGT